MAYLDQSSAWVVLRSGPWWSAPRVSPCCCTCRGWQDTTDPGSRTVPPWLGTAPKPSATRSPPASRRCPSSCAARSPGTKARSWPSTPNSASTPACRSTSVTLTAPGSAAQMRTPTWLLRQYFPKGTDLSKHSQRELAAVAAALISRPRKTLGCPSGSLERSSTLASDNRCCKDPLNLASTQRTLCALGGSAIQHAGQLGQR
jgi:hypothetical protein